VLVLGAKAVAGSEGVTTLVKPYTMPELCDTVRQAAGDRCLEGQA